MRDVGGGARGWGSRGRQAGGPGQTRQLPCAVLRPSNRRARASRGTARAEAQTFLASLRAALGLEPSATLEACANRLDQALAGGWVQRTQSWPFEG